MAVTFSKWNWSYQSTFCSWSSLLQNPIYIVQVVSFLIVNIFNTKKYINEIFKNWLTYFINQVHNSSQLLKRNSLVDNTRDGHERKLHLDAAVVGRRQDKGRSNFKNHQSLIQRNGQANITSKNAMPAGRLTEYVLI